MVTGTIDDVCLGTNIAFCADGKNYVGLQNLVHIENNEKDIFIIDNHNHAFYCRGLAQQKNSQTREQNGIPISQRKLANPPTLIHIDQHSDMNKPLLSYHDWLSGKQKLDIQTQSIVSLHLANLGTYTNDVLAVNNFIIPAQGLGIIGDIVQIRTEGSLKSFFENFITLQPSPTEQDFISLCNFGSILDIDVDFRDPRMSFDDKQKTYDIVRSLIGSPRISCVTIATSPYFMEQAKAVEIIQKFL